MSTFDISAIGLNGTAFGDSERSPTDSCGRVGRTGADIASALEDVYDFSDFVKSPIPLYRQISLD